jgi:hypothetical protein
VAVTNDPHAEPRLKSRAIPLLPLWAFMACIGMNFTVFTFTSQSDNKEVHHKRSRPVQLRLKYNGRNTSALLKPDVSFIKIAIILVQIMRLT